MNWLFDFLFLFLGMGLTEAVIKPLAKRFVTSQINKVLPAALEFLDLNMPEMIFQYTGSQMNHAMRLKLEDLLGRTATQSEIDTVFQTYDARISSDFHHEIGIQG
jgi:hypothetical protein